MTPAVRDGAARIAGRGWLDRLSSPMRTRRGRFSPLKSFVFVLLFLPALWLAWGYAHNELGSRPVLALVHGTGLWTIRLVVVTLALTPVRYLLDWPGVSVLRRMIGVAAACYALLHLSLFCAQQNFHMLHVVLEIARRIYLLIGLAALCGLVALALTSTDARMRAMGRNWKRLHKLIYPVALLGLLHFFLQAKADVFQAVVVAGLLSVLLLWRLLPGPWRASPFTAPGMAVLAVLSAIVIEAAWYGLATGIPARRVLLANLHFVHWRPSAWVAAIGLAFALVIAARQLAPRLQALIRPGASASGSS